MFKNKKIYQKFYSTYARILVSTLSNLMLLVEKYSQQVKLPTSAVIDTKEFAGMMSTPLPTIDQMNESIFNSSGFIKKILGFASRFLHTGRDVNLNYDLINEKLKYNIKVLDTTIEGALKKENKANVNITNIEEVFKNLNAHNDELAALIANANEHNSKLNDFINQCKVSWEENERIYKEKIIERLERGLNIEFSSKEKEIFFGNPTMSHLALLSELESDQEFAKIAPRKKENLNSFGLRAYILLAEYKRRISPEVNLIDKASSIIKSANQERNTSLSKLNDEWKNIYSNLSGGLLSILKESEHLLGLVSEDEKKLAAPEKLIAPLPPPSPQPLPKEKY